MASYYVNPSAGNDTFTGSMAQPFATVGQALSVALPGDIIYLARGYRYPILSIVGKDGLISSPYTWDAYGIGTDPIISAFVDPTGSWVDEGGNVWSYQNPSFDQVNVVAISQTNQPLARWPKPQVAEYYPIDAATGNTSITDNTHLAAAPNFVGGELVSKKRKWTIDRATITGQTSSTISVAGFDTNYVVGNGYFVQNHINCLTEQGDWCYEAGTDTVYFYSTTDPNSLSIQISLDEHALHLENSDYHAFHNLIFEGGSRHNIFLEFSHNVSFTGCISRLAGIDGLKTFVSENATWLDGYMYDVNNHGVNNRDASEGLTVTGSSFVRIAAIPGMGQSGSGQQNGVHINNTEHNALIEGNFFFQIGNNGVSYRGNNCYVARNYAEKCGWTVSDAAAFYSFGNFANPDTNVICEYNIAYDCRGNIDGIGGTPKYDTCGFYTDDNCKDNVTRYNIARKCGYGYYIHNNDGVVYRHNIAEDCDVLFRFADDTTQGVSTTRRIRNVDVQFNTLKALPGQKVYEARVLGVFAGDAPFDFGTIDNNQIDAADASPIQVHLTNNFDNMVNLAAWRTDYGFDLNSNTDPYDASGTVFFANDSAGVQTFTLDGVYEDWDQVENATGSVTLQPNESVLLFRIGDFPTNAVQFVNAAPTEVYYAWQDDSERDYVDFTSAEIGDLMLAMVSLRGEPGAADVIDPPGWTVLVREGRIRIYGKIKEQEDPLQLIVDRSGLQSERRMWTGAVLKNASLEGIVVGTRVHSDYSGNITLLSMNAVVGSMAVVFTGSRWDVNNTHQLSAGWTERDRALRLDSIATFGTKPIESGTDTGSVTIENTSDMEAVMLVIPYQLQDSSVDESNVKSSRLFKESFESGVWQWEKEGELNSTIYQGSGNSVISNEQAKTGTHSLKMSGTVVYDGVDDIPAQSNNYLYDHIRDFDDLVYDFSIYLPQYIDFETSAPISFFNLLQIKGVEDGIRNDPMWVLYLNVRGGKGSGGPNYLQLTYMGQFWPELGGTVAEEQTRKNEADVPLNDWFNVRVRIKKHQTDGIIQVWKVNSNGTILLLFDVRNINTFPQTLVSEMQLSINNYGQATIPRTTHIYLDDVSVHQANSDFNLVGDFPVIYWKGKRFVEMV